MKLLTLILVSAAVAFGAIVWLSRHRTISDARSRDPGAKGSDTAGARVDREREHGSESTAGVRGWMPCQTDDTHAFYFRGPNYELNVPARSIEALFEVAEAVDDEVWQYHLVRGDYARWFRDVMGDERLARRAEDLANGAYSSHESRSLLRSA